MNIIEPNYFKMRVASEFPLWKRVCWRIFGTKDFGESYGYYVEGYWLRGTCLITKVMDAVEDYDPTPHCTWCGAMSAKNCKCPPRAEND